MRKRFKKVLLVAFALLLSFCTIAPLTGQPAHAARDWGGYMWKIEGKRIYVGQTGGSWKTGIRARADGGSGDTIHMGTSKSVSNSITSTCGISKKNLNSAFSFNVSRSWSTNASKTYGLTGKKKGSWWAIQYKPIHKKYKIKTRQYSFINGKWCKTSKTKWIYAKRFDHFAYRLVKSSAPK